jgi:hypothetical protein
LLELLAFTARDVAYQVVIFACALLALYGMVKLVDLLGLGARRPSLWRFTGSEPAVGYRRRRRSRPGEDDNPFQTLGISPTDDLDAINAAYIRLARQTHPDLNPDDDKAKEKFQRVQYAFSRVGNETALRRYLAEHPLETSWDVVESGSEATIVDLDQFQQDLVAYRAAWRVRQAIAERDLKYLRGPSPAGWRVLRGLSRWLKRYFGRPVKRRIVVERVCFLREEGPQDEARVPYLQVFDKLLRVGTQQQVHDVVTFLLRYNGTHYVDRFHTRDTVSFHDIDRRPGQNAALSPSGNYADFVTNLAKLHLYDGPDVTRIR